MKQTIINRNATYYELLPNLAQSRYRVVKALKQHQPCTCKQLSSKMRLPINMISGRMTELLNMGVIEIFGTEICTETKKPNTIYIMATGKKEMKEPEISTAKKVKKIKKEITDLILSASKRKLTEKEILIFRSGLTEALNVVKKYFAV